MAKDRLNPCIHYVCKGETCKKGFKDVTLAKCKTCEKYRPRKSGEYEAEEGCLSLTGTRKTTRYRDIEVKYQDPSFKWQKQKFSGPIAQVIQHDMRDGNLRFPWSSLCVA